jgi:hypothetical protein
MLLCGDWNIDFVQDGGNPIDLEDLLSRYISKYSSIATRVTKPTSTLIGVMIMDLTFCMEPLTVIELGLSDHHTQTLPVVFKNYTKINRRIL